MAENNLTYEIDIELKNKLTKTQSLLGEAVEILKNNIAYINNNQVENFIQKIAQDKGE